MKVTWLAHAGLLFENEKIAILVDPYLSDSLAEKSPLYRRSTPPKKEYFDVNPDVILVTHSHGDHLDPETVKVFLGDDRRECTVLAPRAAYEILAAMTEEHNVVELNPHSVWSENGITFYSVAAAHSDKTACGFIIDDGEKTYYISGGTLYNFDVIDDVLDLAPSGVDYAFLTINGRGNNMHARDAADFAYEIGAHNAIPVGYGLFDDIDPAEFDFEDAIILEPYTRIEL